MVKVDRDSLQSTMVKLKCDFCDLHIGYKEEGSFVNCAVICLSCEDVVSTDVISKKLTEISKS